jgi:hypothetical protein
MPEPDDTPERVTAVEREVRHLRADLDGTARDAQAARLLAAGADHDVSEVRAELRAHTRAISALHDDQVELRAEMYAFRDETRQGFATVNAGMAQIVDLLGQIADP